MGYAVLWSLPVPSTSLLDGGPMLEKRLGRELAIKFSYETEEGPNESRALVFRGVEAFKCTYLGARSAAMLTAYDTLVDCGVTSWLTELRENLVRAGADVGELQHMMINFDDGPAYEVVCRSFSTESA